MNSKKLLSCIAITVACACGGFASPEILTIYSTTPKGVSQGTGFFVSNDGMFITAYHVVRNATRIDAYIERNNRSYAFTNIAIAALDAGHDLAVLRVIGAQSVKSFPLVELATISGKDNLEVRGNPRGMVEQVFRASTTRDELVKSTGVFDKAGEKIFRSEIDVFLLESVAYGGLSGAPVIRDGQVVGVLSGSLDEQKGITWAIPASRVLALLRGQLGNTLVENQNSWPAFTLMRSNWRSLTREFARNDDAFEVVFDHRKMLSKLQDAVQQVGGHAYVAERHNITMRSIVAIISSDPTQSEAKKLEIANQLIRNPANLVNASDLLKAITAVANIHETREELYTHALKVEDWITHTDLSDKERNRFTLALKRIKLKYPQTFGSGASLRPKELDEALTEARKALSDPNGIKFTNMAGVRRFGAACEVTYSMTADLSQPVGIQKVVEELEAHKALGGLAERYLEYLVYLKELPRTEQAK